MMGSEPDDLYVPGQWQANMVRRVAALGYAGFMFGVGVRWWVIDAHHRRVAGPFRSTDEFDDWLTCRERRRAPAPFTCPFCASFSHNPKDAEQRYCARCNVFVDDVKTSSPAVRQTMGSFCRRLAECQTDHRLRDEHIWRAEVWEGKHD
jgi:hypothetical protein